MYLYKKTYVKNWEFTPEDDRHEVAVARGGQPMDKGRINSEKVTYIVEDAGYWRKANAIHHWFVEHVQDGDDNCGTYYVSREHLHELLERVERVLEASELVEGQVTNGYRYENGTEAPIVEAGKVIKDPTVARQLLPTQGGFFFGSTEYDAYYVEDLALTKEILGQALADEEADEFEYTSSW